MDTSARRLEFAPPPTPGLLRALILAILAHGVLLAVLTAGVQWKRETVQSTVEAELWSAIPVQAAPPAPEPGPEPEPPKPVPPVVKPEPKPEPPPPVAQAKAQADIAIAKEKEKARQLQEKQLALEKEKLAKEKLAKEKLEQDKKKQAELEKQKLAKQEQDKKDKLKKEQADKLAAEKEKQAEAAAAKSREDQIKRMERLAGGSSGGGNTPGGAAATQSSGPSASYAGRVAARIKPNITYPDNIDGNPRVEVEIRTAPSGSILSARITQSSGVKSWDEAITRAIEKTEVLPKDVDGSVLRSLLIGFRPKD